MNVIRQSGTATAHSRVIDRVVIPGRITTHDGITTHGRSVARDRIVAHDSMTALTARGNTGWGEPA